MPLIPAYGRGKKGRGKKGRGKKGGQNVSGLRLQAGVPEDVFVTTTGRGATGAAVASLPRLGGVFFTGSNPTGVKIAAAAAPNMVKVSARLFDPCA
jgi:hypothetical protein